MATDPGPTPASPDGSGAIPSDVSEVPDYLGEGNAEGSGARHIVGSDLDVGRGAVAFVTSPGLPVVIGASDGAYHLLDLPGYDGVATHAIVLSPDGRSLAFVYTEDPHSDTAATRDASGGIRVVDLMDGTTRSIPIPVPATAVSGLAWSPGSAWLAWSTFRASGRIAPRARTSASVPVRGVRRGVVAVSDAGRVLVVARERVVLWDGHQGRRLPISLPTVAGASFGPGGRLVSFGSVDGSLRVLDIRTGAIVLTNIPAGPTSEVDPVGWVDRDTPAFVTTFADALDSMLVLARPAGPPSAVASVGTGPVSVAVDLVSADNPPVVRPTPHWPWSRDRQLGVGEIVLGCAAALLALLRWLRRRRAGLAGSEPRSSLPTKASRFVLGLVVGAGATVGWSLVALYSDTSVGELYPSGVLVAQLVLGSIGLYAMTTRPWRGFGVALILVPVPTLYAELIVLILGSLD